MGWNLYKEFCSCFNTKFELPILVQYVRAFSTWAITARGLKSSTVKSYISSLNTTHVLSSVEGKNLNSDTCVKMILKGAENSFSPKHTCKTNRLPMNIHLLNVLGHKIANLGWTDYSKQIVWTACVISFFTSCRMGELLPSHEKSYDPLTAITWKKINFTSEKEILIFVPFTKTTGLKGKIVDIFQIENDSKCPVAAIKKLKRMAISKGVFKPENSVFAFGPNNFLMRKKLNNYLRVLLGEFFGPNHQITGHSFRAAVPSALAASLSNSTVKDIKDWGCWASDSYLIYTKQESEKCKALFTSIVKCLYDL